MKGLIHYINIGKNLMKDRKIEANILVIMRLKALIIPAF